MLCVPSVFVTPGPVYPRILESGDPESSLIYYTRNPGVRDDGKETVLFGTPVSEPRCQRRWKGNGSFRMEARGSPVSEPFRPFALVMGHSDQQNEIPYWYHPRCQRPGVSKE